MVTHSLDFDLRSFSPYLLNMAAEQTSLAFQPNYKNRYGMLRTEWRVLFHVGRYGPITSKGVCARARIHKTKVSRAVAALEQKRFLKRQTVEEDRRNEMLSLTTAGHAAFQDLSKAAKDFDTKLMAEFDPEERAVLLRCLERLAGI